MAVAFAAPEIANLLQVKPPTFSFLSGFLHDYGKAIIEKRLSLDTSVILELVTTEQIPVDEAETRLIGIDHAEIGAMIFEKWNFPQPIVDAVRWHHKPGLYPGDSLLVNFIHIADAIALSMGIGPKDEGLQYRISSEILSRLNFNTRKIESLICIVQEEMENLKSFFTPMIGEKRMLPLNVLIVIDSKFVPPVLSKTLEMAEIAVKKLHIARNGMEGLNLLRSQPVDIVFTDIRMPVMDGIEMIGAMHEDEKLKQIPVIVFSSEESQNRIDELKSLGVGSYLRKPFSSETIANTIREALEFSTRVGR